MQTYRQLFREKTENEDFSILYEQECNVCAYTVRIFEKIESMGVVLEQLATDLNTSVDALIALKEADCCKPRLVIDLCRYLSLEKPPSCPKLA